MRFIYLEVIYIYIFSLCTPQAPYKGDRQSMAPPTTRSIIQCARLKKESQYFDCFCFCFYLDNRDHFKGRSPLGRLVTVFLRADCCKELQTARSRKSSVF